MWLRQADDENVVYDPETSAVHLLNVTATAIWVLCDGETTPEEMVDAICELSGLRARWSWKTCGASSCSSRRPTS